MRGIIPYVIGLLTGAILFWGCSHLVADELPGAAESGDLSATIGGCGFYTAGGLIKCTPNIGTATENLSVIFSAPPAKKLGCGKDACVKVEIRDGSGVRVTKWFTDGGTTLAVSFAEILGEKTFEKFHSKIFGVTVTIYFNGGETDLFGEIRLKPVAEGYKWLAPGDKFTAIQWACFDQKHECGASTRGRTYLTLAGSNRRGH